MTMRGEIEPASPRDLVQFAFLLAAAFYLAGAIWSALFILALPQDRDWCKEVFQSDEEGGGNTTCVSFKNTFEQLKYYNNVKMVGRNRYWIYGQLAVGAFLGWVRFWRSPRRRQPFRGGLQTPIGAMAYGATIALLGPLLLAWLLPAPARWFPRQLTEYADARVAREVELLRTVANDIDGGRRTP